MKARVLLVEDDAALLGVLARMFSGEFDVVAVANANDALIRVVAGEDFDVLVTDFRMPVLDGGQLIDAVRQRGIDIPAVLVTIPSHARESSNRSNVFYVQKPIDPDELLAVVRAAVASRITE